MLKILFMFFSLMYFIFKKNKFWFMMNMFFFMFFFIFLFKNLLNFPSLISYFLGIDLISYSMILLTVWIMSLMMMSSEIILNFNNKLNWFMFMMMFMIISLFLTFSSLNLFMFYFFFEMSLIPTFFLILGWGYQPERLQAGFYLLFYTLLASLPLLMSILYFQNYFGVIDYYLLTYNIKFNLMYFSFMMAFLVKMPLFFFHLWLPKAHVEAPISGSMILAGILLKLGGYGIMRFMIFIQMLNLKYNLIFYVISLVGGSLISLICLMQIDMKSLIAYSSVAHMSIVISGLLTLTIWGFTGSYILMIGHGLCSSGMFCLANIIYERTKSRSLFINKGLINFIPSMSMWWFLLLTSNMAAPPSFNLIGEIFLLNSIINWSFMSIFFILNLSFFSAVYSLYLFSFTQHGMFFSFMNNFSMILIRENLILMLHWIPLNFLILKSEFCLFLF